MKFGAGMGKAAALAMEGAKTWGLQSGVGPHCPISVPPTAEKPLVGAQSHETPNQTAIHNQSQQSRETEGADAHLPEPGQSPAGSSRAEQPRCLPCPQTPWDGASEGWEP